MESENKGSHTHTTYINLAHDLPPMLQMPHPQSMMDSPSNDNVAVTLKYFDCLLLVNFFGCLLAVFGRLSEVSPPHTRTA